MRAHRSNAEGQQVLPLRHVQFFSPCHRGGRDVTEGQLHQFFARGRAPDTDGAVARCRSHAVTTRFEGNPEHLLAVAAKHRNGLPGLQVPHASGAILRCGRYGVSVA